MIVATVVTHAFAAAVIDTSNICVLPSSLLRAVGVAVVPSRNSSNTLSKATIESPAVVSVLLPITSAKFTLAALSAHGIGGNCCCNLSSIFSILRN